MRLVFIHGWGFAPGFFDTLAGLLPEQEQARADLGFFGTPFMPEAGGGDILVGHSFGFLQGMRLRSDWRGWVAINGFARFAGTGEGYCVPPASLQGLQMMMGFAGGAAMAQFYAGLGAIPPVGSYDIGRLAEGLDILAETDISGTLTAAGKGLALAAADDPLTPAAASAYLAGQAPGSKLKVIETGGHLLPLVRPGWCAEQIKAYLAHV